MCVRHIFSPVDASETKVSFKDRVLRLRVYCDYLDSIMDMFYGSAGFICKP